MVRNRGRGGIFAHARQRRVRCCQAVVLTGMLVLCGPEQAPWVGAVDVEAIGSSAAHGRPSRPNMIPSDPVVRPQAATPAESARVLEHGIPATVLDSYLRAVDAQRMENPGCGIGWSLLAGIGKVESGHARGGDVTLEGTAIHPIYGPALDGTNGTTSIEGGGSWARAAGSMQFIPSSWARWGVDGNHDGATDPQNVYDGSRAASRYLCAGSRDLTTPEDLRAAIFSYNHSPDYVDLVLRWMRAYETGGGGVPDQHASSNLLRLASFESSGTGGRTKAATPATVPPPPPPAKQPQNSGPPQNSEPEEPEAPQDGGPAPRPAPEVLDPAKELVPPPVKQAVAPVVEPVEDVGGKLPLPLPRVSEGNR